MDCVQHSIGIMNHKPSEKQWESSNRLSCDDIQHCFSLPPYIVIPHQKTWCEIPNKKQYGISENKVGDILIQCSSEASWNLILHLLYQWVFSVFPFIPVFPNWIVLHIYIYIYIYICVYVCIYASCFVWVWNLVAFVEGRNVGWGCFCIGCWGEYFGLRGAR